LNRTLLRLTFGSLLVSILTGCQLFVNDADREVYKLIEQRQLAALGKTSDVKLAPGAEHSTRGSSDPYSYVPHPASPEVPDGFVTPEPESAEPIPQPEEPTTAQDNEDDTSLQENDQELPQPGEDPAQRAEALLKDAEIVPDFGKPFPLHEALAHAIKHSHEYQNGKEDLYLAALSLTLERHMWTPRFLSSLQATYTEYPQNSDPDRALRATADVVVEQRLPYGGQVVAQWVGSMVRDLENHVTNGESGTAILQANIPLLRGAGRVAYESRYQGERNLIYAVRRFERFRRSFLTKVAGDYFDLLSLKSSIRNSGANRDASKNNYDRSQALADAEKINRQESDRAYVDYLQSRNRVINSIEAYESALDEFKITIGMDTTEGIDVVEEDLNLPFPQVDQQQAISTALSSRLDLLTTLDRVDDARRSQTIARNNLLPDLDISAGVNYTTKDDHLNSFDFREDQETWTVGADLEIPLDRKSERNALRSSLINLRRAERSYDMAADRVRLEVRRALRKIRQARFSLLIQEENIRSNEIRRAAAKARFELGELSNRDVVDADNDLLDARDAYDDALSTHRSAILGFWLSSGTLRVSDDGYWLE